MPLVASWRKKNTYKRNIDIDKKNIGTGLKMPKGPNKNIVTQKKPHNLRHGHAASFVLTNMLACAPGLTTRSNVRY